METLKEKHPSIPFNPDIANAFFRAGLIEAWGRGIEKIRIESKKHGIPVPEYEFQFSGFWLELRSPKSSPKTKDLVFQNIQENPNISIEDLSTVLEKSKRTILKKVDELKKEGKLERIGSSRSGHWRVL